mmetsp:Transcript_12122/g.18306  ORF Transcript_12122/g.18306 Transcript_12122/m.18306 type:complete len:199 (-) Transcript_12122:13-609(-)
MAHKGKHSSSITSIPATLQTEATTKISDVSLFSSVDDVISACQPPASSYPQSCSICFQEFSGDCCNFALIVLPYCRNSHCFCRDCARRMLDTSGKCGVCMKYYIASTGTQPVNGRMRVAVLPPSRLRLPGHEDCGVIVIRYEFPSGVQGPEHPNAGQRYRGTKRQAYLPDNELGRKVLAMLQTCFQRRLTFTVGMVQD